MVGRQVDVEPGKLLALIKMGVTSKDVDVTTKKPENWGKETARRFFWSIQNKKKQRHLSWCHWNLIQAMFYCIEIDPNADESALVDQALVFHAILENNKQKLKAYDFDGIAAIVANHRNRAYEPPAGVPCACGDEQTRLHHSRSALCPKIIDFTKSHDDNEDDDDDDVVEVIEEPLPSAVRIPFSQEEDDVAAPHSGEPTSFLSSKDCTLLDSPDQEEPCQALSKFKITLAVSSIVLLGTMLLLGWHDARFWSEQQPNPWRVSFFSREAMLHRPRSDPIQTMTTFLDVKPGPWQERDEVMGSGMTNPYLPRP